MSRLNMKELRPSCSLFYFICMLAGYGILMALSGMLLIRSLFESFRISFFFASLLCLFLVAFIIEHIRELPSSIRSRDSLKSWGFAEVMDFITLVFAALFAFVISHDLGLGPVTASALVGIIGAIALPKYAVAIFCGSFVGMISHQLALGYIDVILSGAIAGIVYVLSKEVFSGFGGKLGTIAFSGCVLMALVKGKDFLIVSVPGWDVAWILVLYSIIGAVLTYVINNRLKHGPVMASGIVGIIGGLLLPALYPTIGSTLAVMVFCASFVGMSSTKRFQNEIPIAIAGGIAGIVFVFSAPHLGGAGGKLGTIAFISTISVAGIFEIKRLIAMKIEYLKLNARDVVVKSVKIF